MNYELGFENESQLVRFLSILSSMTEKISEHRKNIDDLDLEILKLIQDRIDQAIIIRGLKTEQDIPLFTPEREKDLINRLIDKSAGRLPAEVVEDIWKTIIKGGKRTGDIQ
ncbi:MAG: chorismate mutase [Candidatus Marinimicrobia bacterium]|nr:chorismate mutase [FCB group bacterium]MBL7026576.1 chorismate mutase [Candidatus Neomarinimicrobiota bacterium]